MINDPALASTLLAALETSGAPYAVMHREGDLAAGIVGSDVDLVLSASPAAACRAILKNASSSVRLTGYWQYDVGAVSTFWTSGQHLSLVQLDLTCDPHGLGKYGLRTQEALSTARRGVRWVRLSDSAEVAYLTSKRSLKGQLSEHPDLLGRFAALPQAERARLLSLSRQRQLHRASSGRASAREAGAQPAGREVLSRGQALVGRMAWRARHPCGLWVHIAAGDEMQGQGLAGFLEGSLPFVSGETSLLRASLLRFVPGIRVTSARSEACQADLQVSGTETLDDMRSAVLDLACARAEHLAGLCE